MKGLNILRDSIKYRFAYLKNNEIIDIANVEERTTFKCISCGNDLIAKKGKKMSHHFAHKNTTPGCSFETYLHKLAKKTFFNEYQKCLNDKKPFFIDYITKRECADVINEISESRIKEALKQNKVYLNSLREPNYLKSKRQNIIDNATFHCTNALINKKLDLTKFYTNVYLEKKDGNFTPDILLITKKGEKLYIEIYVTHSVSTEKINSRTNILELKITSEKDTQSILKHYITPKNDSIKYYNFNPPNEKLCEDCSWSGSSFVVLEDKSVFFTNCNIAEHITYLKNNTTNYSAFKLTNYLMLFMGESLNVSKSIQYALEKGIVIKDCNLCRHCSKKSRFSHTIFCKMFKGERQPSFAVSCKLYEIKMKFQEPNKISLNSEKSNYINIETKKYRCNKMFFMKFPDLGKLYSFTNYKLKQITILNFNSILCKEIIFLDNNLFSFTSDFMYDGTLYSISFDFSSDRLKELLMQITSKNLIEEINSYLVKDFTTIQKLELDNIRLLIDIKAKLGKPIKCDYTTFVPFIVEEFNNLR